MPKITLHSTAGIETHEYNSANSLLQTIQKIGGEVFAPCGGNGTCGKCRVKVKHYGTVTSCLYYPTTDIEVILPDTKESKILTDQYKHTLKLPLNPCCLAANVHSPMGLGIDIGTTSMVFYWVDLKTGGIVNTTSVTNPQGRFGADVISRIGHCANEGGLEELQKVLIDAINKELIKLEENEGIINSDIVKVTISANTTILHLLLGIDPTPLALYPFTPAFTDYKIVAAKKLGIDINEQGGIHLLPSISAYVGADIVSGISSIAPRNEIKNYLFIDIGTNGEMAVVTPNEIFCCATAAGPAFEGANIKCGMGAFDGAISEYSDNGYKTVGNDKPIGICGSGLIDIIATLVNNGTISMDGVLTEDFVLADKNHSGNGENIILTPRDVREVQLAKSAIMSGIKILIDKAGLTYNDIDALYLAGGFGNYLNPDNAMRIGLLPMELADRIIPVGNTSGAGAVLHLLSEDFNDVLKSTVEKSQNIELSEHPDFEMEYAMNMYFS